MNCEDQQQQQYCIQYDCSPNEQYENADSCGNCKDPQFSPPDCNQCCPPPTSMQQMQFSQCPSEQNQECPPQFYQQQQQESRCEPCVTTCDPCNPCVNRCNPCEPLGPCPMPCDDDCQQRLPCPPLETCSPMCSPYRRKRYVQPPRRESCKPIVRYRRPEIPMTGDTIYKNSFDGVDAQTAASCRMPPVLPVQQIQPNCGSFAKETVMKLSFQPFCCPEKTRAIYPSSRSLLGQGPMQALTTQKHDFVPKFQYRQAKISPRNNILRSCGCVENQTVQRLSFMAPCNYSRVESCKPIIRYKRPDLPMEFETTQKLSYMPVCPAAKDDMPWARKAKYCPPSIQFAKDTIAKLSYQPPGCFLDDNSFCCDTKYDSMPRASC